VLRFRPAVYLSSYGFAVAKAFTFTAGTVLVGGAETQSHRSYLGSVLFFVTVSIVAALLVNVLQMPTLGRLLNPICSLTVLNPHVGTTDNRSKKKHRSDRTGKLDTRESTPMDRRRFGPYSYSPMYAFDSATEQRDAQDFRSPGQAGISASPPTRGRRAPSPGLRSGWSRRVGGLVCSSRRVLVVLLAPALIALRGVPVLPEPRTS